MRKIELKVSIILLNNYKIRTDFPENAATYNGKYADSSLAYFISQTHPLVT